MIGLLLSAAVMVAQVQPASSPAPAATNAAPAVPTVQRPLGTAVAPVSGSLPVSAPSSYGDAATGNGFTASSPLGPQQNIGMPIPHYIHYIAGDLIAPAIVYNEYAPGSKSKVGKSYDVRGAFEFPLSSLTLMAMVDSRRYNYDVPNRLVNGPAGTGRFLQPAGTFTDRDIDLKVGLKLIDPRLYAGVSFIRVSNDYNYPTRKGVGAGVEKLPDLDQPTSLHGGIWYYPNVGGTYNLVGIPNSDTVLSYHLLRYSLGYSIQVPKSPLFIDAGYLGDRSKPRTNAPVITEHHGPYVGLGLHF